MAASPRYMLLQVRRPDDAMREQEVRTFMRALGCERERIAVVDLIAAEPSDGELDAVDIVLLGGSGDYSVAGESRGGPWLGRALDAMRRLVDRGKPTFASCWGFQAMARALGGRVEHDPTRAELGTIEMTLTDDGRRDAVFGPLGDRFAAAIGHEDVVTELPRGAVRLASSAVVANQAYRIEGLPIYATQFHPELDRASLLERAAAYPRYVASIAGVSFDAWADTCGETPGANALLRRFVDAAIDGRI